MVEQTQKVPRPSRRIRGGTVHFAELAAVLGEKKALQLCRHFHGKKLPSIVQMLRERRDDAIKRDWDAGAQVGELSAKYGLSRANIERRLLQWTQESSPGESESKAELLVK